MVGAVRQTRSGCAYCARHASINQRRAVPPISDQPVAGPIRENLRVGRRSCGAVVQVNVAVVRELWVEGNAEKPALTATFHIEIESLGQPAGAEVLDHAS